MAPLRRNYETRNETSIATQFPFWKAYYSQRSINFFWKNALSQLFMRNFFLLEKRVTTIQTSKIETNIIKCGTHSLHRACVCAYSHVHVWASLEGVHERACVDTPTWGGERVCARVHACMRVHACVWVCAWVDEYGCVCGRGRVRVCARTLWVCGLVDTRVRWLHLRARASLSCVRERLCEGVCACASVRWRARYSSDCTRYQIKY